MHDAPESNPQQSCFTSQAHQSALRLAWRSGKPFAIWRSPGATTAEGLVSLRAISRNATIAFDTHAPAFAISRFEATDGRLCDLILGDLILTENAPRFVDPEGGLHDMPSTDPQRDFADDMARGTRFTGPVLTASTRHDWSGRAPTVTSEDHYKSFVAKAVDAIRHGEMTKVVASRVVRSQLPDHADLLQLFSGLADAYQKAFVCLVSLPDDGVWLLATPEVLVSVDETCLTTMALAGTQAIAPDIDPLDVAWTDKFIWEQGLVSQYVRQALTESGATEYSEVGPKTVRAANLAHLRSDFRIDSQSRQFESQEQFFSFCADLLGRLQPTSAVCGMPRDLARSFIVNNEGYERAYYCGYLGPVGFDGSSNLYVNLRSSQIIADTAYLYVGAGVVSNSSPEEELQETVEKTKTLGRILWSL